MSAASNWLLKPCLRQLKVFKPQSRVLNSNAPFTCLFVQQKRTYFDYETNLTEENQQFVYDWTKVKNTVLGSPLKDQPWTRGERKEKSKRTGLIGVKLGLFPMWSKSGEQFVTTAIQIQECQVIRFEPPGTAPEVPGFGFLYLGAKNASPLYRDEDYVEQFRLAGIPIKQRVFSFMISPEAALPSGTSLHAPHFRPGMRVNVCGRAMGKGFQGVMKRWGFKGQPASHGQTKTHRRPGAIGNTGESKVWKGKKMPGNMGNRYSWKHNLEIMRVNTVHDIVFVKGPVAGKKGGFLMITDTGNIFNTPPPFPTFFPDDNEELEEDIYHPDVFQFSDESIYYEEADDN